MLSQIAVEKTNELAPASDYASYLNAHELEFTKKGHYYCIGHITKHEGWILHLSVIIHQIPTAFNSIIPILEKYQSAFKLPIDAITAESVLNGSLGLDRIGKVISIYPDTDKIALAIAKELVSSTQHLKGPHIPTDVCLGSIVYTCHGHFDTNITPQLNENNDTVYSANEESSSEGNSIPFKMPVGITWPFSELAPPIPVEPPKLLNYIYKPTSLLKSDPKGNVFKGLYVKGWFNVKKCVIKQGFRNMNSDVWGRDIHDRLVWQYELHKSLSPYVPIPKIFDLFEEKLYTVLVMDWVKGQSLFDKLIELNPGSKFFSDLTLSHKWLIVTYCIQLAQITTKMHERGYVHRDINPVNFLIDNKNNITLIDIELAYSLLDNKPFPPFTLGTFGFMSPEQNEIRQPTTKEDIYGLGATLIYIFTGVLPVRFNTRNSEQLSSNLRYFIGNSQLSSVLSHCVNPNPEFRPPLAGIQNTLSEYLSALDQIEKLDNRNESINKKPTNQIESLIPLALTGLTKSPLVDQNGMWYCNIVPTLNTAPLNNQNSLLPGLAIGISGIIYVLSRLHRSGIDITPCIETFAKCQSLLTDKYYSTLSNIPPGLYNGSAGLALSLAEGITSGLLKNDEFNLLHLNNLFSGTSEELNFSNGISGQGLSLLKCKSLLSPAIYKQLLTKFTEKLQTHLISGINVGKVNFLSGKTDPNFDYYGTVSFFLHFLELNPSQKIVQHLIRFFESNLFKHRQKEVISKQNNINDPCQLGNDKFIHLYILIKAYEILHDIEFKNMAEKILRSYPERIIPHDFSQANGLAALGEIYLEAWRIFENPLWHSRAEWCAATFANTFYRTKNTDGYWIMDQNRRPTANLMIGNSGIIHFLGRFLHPEKIGYRIYG